MNSKIVLFILFLISISLKSFSQEVKFGKVSRKELEEIFYENDTSANAVVLYKKRKTYFTYDSARGWSVVTEVHEKVKLYNSDGFEHATKKFRLYYNSGSKKNVKIKALTYNLEGKKIIKTKLDKDAIYDEEISKHWTGKSFTMPNLKDGCIVEWIYTIYSPNDIYINDVICQYTIPIKQLEVSVQIPEYFEFKYLPSRYYPLNVIQSRGEKTYAITTKERGEVSEYILNSSIKRTDISVIENKYTTRKKNIPALIDEPYVNNINNYRAKLKFEFTAYRPKNGTPKFFNTNWKDVTKTIYENPKFGNELTKKSHFLNDLESITTGLTQPNDKIIAIFQFVKSKIQWNGIYSKYTSPNGIKKAYKDGVGNVADINLTLISMLNVAGIETNPILVSTRSHGIPLFPTKDGFNYVIAGVEIKDKVILLDATEKYSTPNVLPLRDLNWEGRLVRENGSSTTINLYPKKYNTKSIKLSTKLNAEGTISGMLITTFSNLNALEYRESYNSISESDLASKFESQYNDIEIEKIRLNNKTNIYKPIVEMIKFTGENQVDLIGNKMYISPLLFLKITENPFKLKERLFPIDYGTPWKNEINASIQIPEGYSIESIPDDFSLKLRDNYGNYNLSFHVDGKKILIKSKTKINSPILGANYYTNLKEFYQQVIDEQSKKIILVQGEI